jgi:Tetratricopeptide repeat
MKLAARATLVCLCACAALRGASASGLSAETESTKTKSTEAKSTTAAEGHRLFRAGQFAPAAAKLETVVDDAKDPELRFELAICYEHLNRDAEAVSAFRAYQRSPVALRVAEANQHLAALAAKQADGGTAAEIPKPRRVVLSVASDNQKCVASCGKVDSPFCRNSSNRMQRACAIQFSCLRGCPGARVEPGTCLKERVSPARICLTDQ